MISEYFTNKINFFMYNSNIYTHTFNFIRYRLLMYIDDSQFFDLNARSSHLCLHSIKN